MIAEFLYSFWPYQIFKSVFFRGGMSFLTTYLVIVVLMPRMIKTFRQWGITSDFTPVVPDVSPYSGSKPIMGGGLLILAIIVSVVCWMEFNQFIVALLSILVAFGLIGTLDDIRKVRNRRRIEQGRGEKKSYSDKADGISGRVRLSMEFAVATVVVLGLYWFIEIDGHLVMPFIPLKWWYPYLPRYLFIPFMVIIIVAGANAVNITDGMDSLAIVPILTCAVFVAAVAYAGSDPDIQQRLRLPSLPDDVREVVVFSAALISAALAFLRFNAPPAMITLGDLGALALGSTISTMFILVKSELFLPIVGGVFVLTTLSTIIQRIYFKWVLVRKGRPQAERRRFFYRAPYHHHLQALWTYSEKKREVESVWVDLLKKIGLRPPEAEDQLVRSEDVNSRVVWRLHMMSIWLLVVSLLIYFKVR